MRNSERLEFHWDANNEGMVWTEDGHPLQGLTGENERIEWILPESFRDGEEHVFYIEMACNGMFGNAPGGDGIQPPDENKYYQLNTARIAAVNLDAKALYYDFWMIGGMLISIRFVKGLFLRTAPSRCGKRIPGRFVAVP